MASKIAPAIAKELADWLLNGEAADDFRQFSHRPHRAGQSVRAILRGQSRLSGMALLEVQGLRQRFGGVTALDGADLTVEQGRITGLIGPNGAGKTTLFQTLSAARCGRTRVRSGSPGADVTGWRRTGLRENSARLSIVQHPSVAG